ncbi:flavin reductase [Candidatus Bipolaricaulota bacterium]|nr:flavin reductase [Candidatus Bipolaricaulota bacterium]
MSQFKIATDSAGLNQALFEVTHGLYVLTAVRGGRNNGQCLDAAMQITNAPPRITIGVGKKSLTHEMIVETGKFVLNALDREDLNASEIVRRFGFQSGRDVDKFEDFPYETGENGIPILPGAKAFYECTVLREFTVDLGTHTLFVASVDRAGTKEDGDPLTYNEYRKSMRKRR